VRWAFGELLEDLTSRGIMMLCYRTRAYLEGQAAYLMDTEEGSAIVEAGLEEMLRIYR
jgi:hypothetical protein